VTTLIVLPLQAEVDILAEALVADGLRLKHAQAGRLPLLAFPEIGAALARGGHGKAQFALHTRHLLDHAGHVDLIVCAGAAGALADELAVGDIVVATRTVEHDFQLRFSSRAAPVFDGHEAAIRSLQALALAEERALPCTSATWRAVTRTSSPSIARGHFEPPPGPWPWRGKEREERGPACSARRPTSKCAG